MEYKQFSSASEGSGFAAAAVKEKKGLKSKAPISTYAVDKLICRVLERVHVKCQKNVLALF